MSTTPPRTDRPELSKDLSVSPDGALRLSGVIGRVTGNSISGEPRRPSTVHMIRGWAVDMNR